MAAPVYHSPYKKGPPHIPPKPGDRWFAVTKNNKRSADEAAKRRTRFVQAVQSGMTIGEAITEVGWSSRSAYEKARRSYPNFAAQVDAARVGAHNLIRAWDGSFIDFRKRYFDRDTPWFHARAIQILENSEPGSITLLLWPPEHGKTGLIEDWLSYKFAVDPSYRVTYVSEKIDHGEKVGYTILGRMENTDECPEYITTFGPFAPQSGGERKMRQSWGPRKFRVWKCGVEHRDPNFKALGITSQVAGTRADLLVGDDIQSLRTINQTAKFLQLLRQDFLSRSGAFGRVVLLGTRVEDDDIYYRMMDEGLVDNVLVFPAHGPGAHPDPMSVKNPVAWPDPVRKRDPIPEGIVWLWPERYSPVDYQRMRVNVGPQGWWRNFMQEPRKAGDRHFTEDMLKTRTSFRRLHQDPPEDVHEICLALDPGYGTNAWMAAGFTDDAMKLLDWRLDHNLTSTEQIFQIAEDWCNRWRIPGHCAVTQMVIEDKAFQRGLLDDRAMRQVRDRFGLVVSSHQTGVNKYDENLGITAMPRAWLRGEIEIPDSDDPATVVAVDQLVSQHEMWRLYKRGNRLQQDLVIVTWFSWLRWTSWKAGRTLDATTFRTQGLPYAVTGSGLLLPTGGMSPITL